MRGRSFGPRALLGAFVAGLLLLAPLALTAIVLSWLVTQLVGFVGPDSLFGQLLTAGGRLMVSDGLHPFFAFALGLFLLLVVITLIGLLVRDTFKAALEGWVDQAIGRIPLLGNVYRPVAQLVRSVSGQGAQEMSAMAVCRVEFGGGIETIALLASPDILDAGNGPCRLVMIPTAPVPVGGALLLVAASKVHPMPDLKFDDLARLYLTMGMTPPPTLVRN